jgi:DNA-directed RNA polymerase subunit N (RpoN/RPB10)
MIIPVRCMTCNNMLASKYRTYQRKVEEYKSIGGIYENITPLITNNIADVVKNRTPEAQALDDVGLKRICCRKHLLTHTEIISQL